MLYEKYSEIRDSKEMTDYQVAKKANIGRSTFSDWKSGRSIPKKEKLQKIADALDVSYSYLIGLTDSEEKAEKFDSILNTLRTAKEENRICAFLTEEEAEIMDLFRNAEDMAKEIALDTLRNHQKKETSSRSSMGA